jgi:hypothetical protein
MRTVQFEPICQIFLYGRNVNWHFKLLKILSVSAWALLLPPASHTRKHARTGTHAPKRIVMIVVMAVSFARRHDIWSWHCTSHITAMYLIVNNKLEAGLTEHCRAWLVVMVLVPHNVSHRTSPSVRVHDSSCILWHFCFVVFLFT